MTRIQMTFDDAHVISFMPPSLEPRLLGTTVLHHEGGLDWAMVRGAKRSALERVRTDTARALPKAELIGLAKGLSDPSSHFEYLAVATQAVIGAFSKQGAAPEGVDLALPTLAALYHPGKKTNVIDGKMPNPEPRLGVQKTPVAVFDPSNDVTRQSLEVACVGGGVASVRTQWSHLLIKDNLERLDGKGSKGDEAIQARLLIDQLPQEIDVIMIVEFHLGGIVLTPLRRIPDTRTLVFNCHSVFMTFDFEAWLRDLFAELDSVSHFQALDEREKVAYLETFLYDLPSVIGGGGGETSPATNLDVTRLADALTVRRDSLVGGLRTRLQMRMWGRTDPGTKDADFTQFKELFHAFSTPEIETPAKHNWIVVKGHIPTGTLAAHSLLGPLVTEAVQGLLTDGSTTWTPKRFEACQGLGRVARLFKVETIGAGNRFWSSVRLGDKLIEQRRPQRQLVTSAAADSSFDLTVTPAASQIAIPLKIVFDLPSYHENSAIEVEVRIGTLERIVVQLFLNGEHYYGGKITDATTGKIICETAGNTTAETINETTAATPGDTTSAIPAYSLGRGELQIFASADHERVYRLAERIGPRAERAWRLV